MAGSDAKSDVIWRAKVGGTLYELTMRDITSGALRQMKGWYGRDYGAFMPFITLLATGDVDAISSALWLAKRKAGERVPADPSFIEFNVADFEALPAEDDESEDQDPEQSEAVRPTERTPESERTSTPSESDTSLT